MPATLPSVDQKTRSPGRRSGIAGCSEPATEYWLDARGGIVRNGAQPWRASPEQSKPTTRQSFAAPPPAHTPRVGPVAFPPAQAYGGAIQASARLPAYCPRAGVQWPGFFGAGVFAAGVR